jgi:hypothetical protein
MEENRRIKKVGTREEVYLGKAMRTSGGLTKNDLLIKVVNGKNHYVSKKLSEIAKERDMFSKYKPKRRTKGHILKITNKDTSKTLTKKNISFSLNNTEYKKYYYPELAGKNIERLRQENEEDDEEEEEEEDEYEHTPSDFRIQDISELNL